VLDHVVRGWLSVKQDGHGWLLVQFAPDADHLAEGAAEQVAREQESVSPTPSPRFGSAEHKVSLLTDREREVLCLVAAGATNCAIGRRLFISPKTASVHVSHILTKLDASTRTEAAAYAHAAGLVQTWSPTGPHAVPTWPWASASPGPEGRRTAAPAPQATASSWGATNCALYRRA
jgi:DNA-binding CsgD family transcriptional regulator